MIATDTYERLLVRVYTHTYAHTRMRVRASALHCPHACARALALTYRTDCTHTCVRALHYARTCSAFMGQGKLVAKSLLRHFLQSTDIDSGAECAAEFQEL